MLEAVLFDLDGVIIDTERHGHRVAFNEAFHRLGYENINWDENLYHRLLQVGGGKERIRYYFSELYEGEPPENMDEFVKQMHTLKTDIFVAMLPDLPLRPGVRRFMREVRDRGAKLGICTTSNERVAHTVGTEILKEIPFSLIIAGDMVKKKKPDPEIYLNALGQLGVAADTCLVVEDSRIGVRAAASAGCRILATYNGYTEAEDLSPADVIVDCLGEPDGPHCTVKKGDIPFVNGCVTAAILDAF